VSTEGAVTRQQVVNVLRAASGGATGFSIGTHQDEEGFHVTLVRDENPEVITLPSMVPRRMLHRLAERYGVKLEWFYYPNMISGPATPQ
jgi:hypothetical protein